MTMQHDSEFETSARELRKLLGIEFDTRPDMITVVFKLRDRGLIKDYRRVADTKMPNDEAFFDPRDQIRYIRESTFAAGNGMFADEGARQRARFTLAEEVGHVWLKHSGLRYRGETGAQQERVVPQIRREEREARHFAGTFLAPSYLAK
jgi:hypothetical protein